MTATQGVKYFLLGDSASWSQPDRDGSKPLAPYFGGMNIPHRSGHLPEPVFSRTKRPFSSMDLREVCQGLLWQIIVKRVMKRISCRTRGEGPHPVYRPSLQGG